MSVSRCWGRLLLVLVALGGITAVAARPPPQPLCEVCADDVVNESDVETSTVSIRLDEDGTGHWTVRMTLRENATLDRKSLRAAAQASLDGHRDEPAPRNLSVTVAGNSATITYDVPRMGHRSAGGVLVVDYFYAHGEDEHWYSVNADRVRIRGPPGTTLTQGPKWISVNETDIVLSGDHGSQFERTISQGWYLAFASGNGIETSIATKIGIGLDVAQVKFDAVPDIALVPTVVLVAVVAGLSRRESQLLERFQRRRPGTVAGLLLAGVLLALAVETLLRYGRPGEPLGISTWSVLSVGNLGGTPSLVVVALALASQYALLTRETVTVPRRWMIEAGRAGAALAVLGGVWAAGTGTPVTENYGVAVGLLVPLLFLPLGLADRRGVRRLLVATVVCSPILLVLGFGPFGGDTAYGALLYAPWALVTGAVGTVAYAYGRSRRENAAIQ